MSRLVPMDHGQRLDLGDRELVLLKPPTYDAPETTGFFDMQDTRAVQRRFASARCSMRPHAETEAIPDPRCATA